MTVRTITYLTHNRLLHLAVKGAKAGYNNTLSVNRINRLAPDTVFPVLYHFIHTEEPPVVRATLMLSESDFVLLDMSLPDFNQLPRMDIDDSPSG